MANVTIRFARFDCGAKIGVAMQVGEWRRGWKFRNPLFVKWPDA